MTDETMARTSNTLADDKADLLLRNVAEFMADLPDGPTRYYLTHMKSEVERLRRESGLKDALIDAMTDCIGPEDGQTFEERAEELIVTEVAHQNAKANENETLPAASFQDRVLLWMRNCFVRSDAMDPVHRSFRFTEEALEFAQATGCSQDDAHRLVDYVYNRPVGEASQEGGGVMVTLAALLTSLGLNLNECGEGELERCIENTDRIRAKDLAKPERSPLPGAELKATASAKVVPCGNPVMVGTEWYGHCKQPDGHEGKCDPPPSNGNSTP